MVNILNGDRLLNVFGHWPTFHDAETLRFSLDREGFGEDFGPTADCTIRLSERTSEVDSKGFFIARNHVLVTLRFTGVEEIEFSGFNHQNVLWKLEILPGEDRDDAPFTVHFRSSFGFGGWFECRTIEVTRVEPCDASGRSLG